MKLNKTIKSVYFWMYWRFLNLFFFLAILNELDNWSALGGQSPDHLVHSNRFKKIEKLKPIKPIDLSFFIFSVYFPKLKR